MDSSRPYPTLTLLELVQRIIHYSDREAVEELLHHRSYFQDKSGNFMDLGRYLECLCQQMPKLDPAIVGDTVKLTLRKFRSFPNDRRENDRPTRMDCRRRYRTLDDFAFRLKTEHPEDNALVRERKLSGVLQGLVIGNFYRSLQDCRRTHSHWSRYKWHYSGKSITVWMPKRVSGGKRKKWLENHIPYSDPPLEREQIQKIIDNFYGGMGAVIDFDPVKLPDNKNPKEDLLSKIMYQKFLERIVAEKIKEKRRLPPSIRNMQEKALYHLIDTIIDRTKQGSYVQRIIAHEFNVDTVDLNRFARKKWPKRKKVGNPKGRVRIPLLWDNMAKVFSQNPSFREAAQETGVWSIISEWLYHEEDGERL